MKSAKEPSTIATAVQELDLDCIKVKLMHAEEGDGWTRNTADRIEREYRRFLILTLARPEPIVPSKDIDEFWHAHILDTRKYMDDCETICGEYIHHFPYFGMRGDDDAINLQNCFATTKEVYEQVFEEPYPSGSASNCENCGSCAASCGVGGVSSSFAEDCSPLRPSLRPALG